MSNGEDEGGEGYIYIDCRQNPSASPSTYPSPSMSPSPSPSR